MSYSSYKLSEFSLYELNIMVIGVSEYVKSYEFNKYDAYKLGVLSTAIVENVLIVKEKRAGHTHLEHVTHHNVDFMSSLNDYDDLIDFLIEYLYRHFDALEIHQQYFILKSNLVPNLQNHYDK